MMLQLKKRDLDLLRRILFAQARHDRRLGEIAARTEMLVLSDGDRELILDALSAELVNRGTTAGDINSYGQAIDGLIGKIVAGTFD